MAKDKHIEIEIKQQQRTRKAFSKPRSHFHSHVELRKSVQNTTGRSTWFEVKADDSDLSPGIVFQ